MATLRGRFLHPLVLLLLLFSVPAFADSNSQLNGAREALDQDRPDKALAILQDIDPVNQAEANRIDVMIGEIYLSVGKPAKALTFFEQAAFSSLEDSAAMAGMAEAALGVGKLQQAKQYAQSALREDHDAVRAHLVLARIAATTGNSYSAGQQLERLLDQKAGNQDVAIAYANFLYDKGEAKKAFEVLENFTRKYLNTPKALDFLGRLYWMDGQEQKAVRTREEAGKLYQKNGNDFRAEVILNWVLDHKGAARNKSKSGSGKKGDPNIALINQPERIMIPFGFRPDGSGSGFIIMEGRYVVTNHHVIEGASRLIVRNGTGEVRNAHVVKYSPMTQDDLALLELDVPYDPSYEVSIDTMGDPTPGRQSIIMGYPLASILGTTLPSISEGAVSKTTGFEDHPAFFQSTAKVNKGNSGGPIFDQYGNLIGVVVSKLNKVKQLKERGFIPEDVNQGIKISRFFNLMGWPGGQSLENDRQDALTLEELYQDMLPKTVYIQRLAQQ